MDPDIFYGENARKISVNFLKGNLTENEYRKLMNEEYVKYNKHIEYIVMADYCCFNPLFILECVKDDYLKHYCVYDDKCELMTKKRQFDHRKISSRLNSSNYKVKFADMNYFYFMVKDELDNWVFDEGLYYRNNKIWLSIGTYSKKVITDKILINKIKNFGLDNVVIQSENSKYKKITIVSIPSTYDVRHCYTEYGQGRIELNHNKIWRE